MATPVCHGFRDIWRGVLQWSGTRNHHGICPSESDCYLYQPGISRRASWRHDRIHTGLPPRPARRGPDLLPRHLGRGGRLHLQLQGRHVHASHHTAGRMRARDIHVKYKFLRQLHCGHLLGCCGGDRVHQLPRRQILGYHWGERVECVPVVWGRDLLDHNWRQRVHALSKLPYWGVQPRMRRNQRWNMYNVPLV